MTDLTRFGIRIGHATDDDGATGCTVLLGADGPLRGAVHVLGRATGSRELAALDPTHLVDRVDAILLTGGSAYGLEAAGGLMRWLEERGRGFPVGGGVVPIVPAAVIFDLAPLGRFDARPTGAMARAAADTASASGIAEGSVGAGAGATVGKGAGADRAMKGGVGLAVVEGGGIAAGAIAVVNAFGDVRDALGRILAGARAPNGLFADTRALLAAGGLRGGFGSVAGTNTTLAVVFVDRVLPRGELQALAAAATGALQRRITPTGTLLDGDVVFAVCPQPGSGADEARLPGDLFGASVLAQDALERAIERGVRLAHGRDGIPGLADLPPA